MIPVLLNLHKNMIANMCTLEILWKARFVNYAFIVCIKINENSNTNSTMLPQNYDASQFHCCDCAMCEWLDWGTFFQISVHCANLWIIFHALYNVWSTAYGWCILDYGIMQSHHNRSVLFSDDTNLFYHGSDLLSKMLSTRNLLISPNG